jgi:uncharacterized membrane protein YqaE (UPF0057 family)
VKNDPLLLRTQGEIGMETNKLLKIIIALLIPPLAVFLHENKITNNFWINLVLTIFLPWIGGVLHAVYVILK